jgi:hypothetical protein
MSLLPQRKKSPEELAKLRENLGIPGAAVKPHETTPPAAPSAPTAHTAPAAATVSREARPVRSLRKSEQLPPATPLPESPPDSALPHVRHSKREIQELRRREVLSMMNTVPDKRLFPAHPAIVLPGYLLPPAAAAGIWFYQIPPAATAACALVSLAIAGVILWQKPISRHHAAFIAALALFLLVFSALHYFPQLRHAT